MRRPLRTALIALALGVAAGCSLGTALSAPPPTLLRLDGIGPLKLGMSRTAAVSTGWLAGRKTGCPLGGPPLPVTFTLSGPKAPAGIAGVAEFTQGRLRSLSFTGGVRTAAGVVLGTTTTAQMVARYRSAGFAASARYDDTFAGTFVTVQRGGKQRLGAFGEKARPTLIGIPDVPVCE